MKMTETSEFEAELFSDIDDILNSEFIEEVINSVFESDLNGSDDECDEPTKTIHFSDDEQIDNISNVIKRNKRKLSNVEIVDKTEKCRARRSSTPPQSPNIDLLKRAVERLKNDANANHVYKSNEVDNTRSGLGNNSNETTVIETRKQIERIYHHTKTIQTSQINDQPHLQKIVSDILKGYKVMIIMRGPPGCGKSFLARDIIDSTTKDCYSDHIFSACDFFYTQDGCYNYDPADVPKSHQWNQAHINFHANDGWSPIIVDNTNTKKWEMSGYFKTAVQEGYLVEIVEPNTPWSRSADDLVAMNVHEVPKEVIDRMISNYEPTTATDLMKSIGLKYSMKMPQYRRLPALY